MSDETDYNEKQIKSSKNSKTCEKMETDYSIKGKNVKSRDSYSD
jgi:hypothetical protein